MRNLLPVVERELRVTARQKALYVHRGLLAFVAMGIAGMLMFFMWRLPPSRMGISVFYTLSCLAFIHAATVGIWITSDCISQERREGTLGLLFLTDLGGLDIILGKLTATSLKALTGLLAIFPVLAIPLLLGSVESHELWRVMLVLGNTMLLSLAAGIFVSTLSHSPKGALIVDRGAKTALREQGKSLLPKGVSRIDGIFSKGEVVSIRDEEGTEFAMGITRFDAENTLRAIETYRTASTIMVPTHFVRLLALDEEVKAKYDISSMVSVSHTGAKCPVDVKRSMIEWFGPVFRDAYGASEVGTTCMISSEEWLEHPGSVGKSIPPFTAMILDDNDQPVPPNTEGRLFFEDATGRGVVYHNDPEKSAAAHIRPGVFTLGEIAYMNEEGYVFITDRFSDMIVSGGVNIYPAEAEQVLIDHPSILDVACIGVPHPEMGEELKALAILRDDAAGDANEIIHFCRDRLSHYKCPKTVEFVTDLGRNTMGKINKRKLRAPYWEGHS